MSGSRIVERIPAALDGERLDRVVSLMTGCSRREASELIDAAAVSVDGQAVSTRTQRLNEGQEVAVELSDSDAAPALEPDPGVEFSVVFADEAVIVVDKPAGLVVHPGAGHLTGTLVHGLLARYPELAGVGEAVRPGIVHRLDRDTSGLLVVARTEAARVSLVDQLAARSVDRRYDTLVWGRPTAPSGVVDAPIGRSARARTRMAVSSDGREAVTRYEVRDEFTDPVVVSRLLCRLLTGRTHQIRVHLAAIGHPVVGDRQYRGDRESLPAPRQWLHAFQLGFRHPVSGDDLTFASALPADLVEVLARLS